MKFGHLKELNDLASDLSDQFYDEYKDHADFLMEGIDLLLFLQSEAIEIDPVIKSATTDEAYRSISFSLISSIPILLQ